MKRFAILAACAVMCAASALAQNKIFAKYADQKDIDYVCVSRPMLRLMSLAGGKSMKVNDVDISKLSGVLDRVLIIDSTNRKNTRTMAADFATLRRDPAYEVLMEARSGDETTVTLLNSTSDPHEFIMFVRDEEDATFIVMTGDFSADDVGQLVK